MSVANIRKSYTAAALNETDLAANPIDQFQTWLNEALKSDLLEPTAMNLATATPEGKPSSRMVLLKDVREDGFVFYSNYESRKGQNLKTNPYAALSFYWDALERQVRIEGTVSRLSRKASEAYFRSRPPGSQMGAVASEQSELIASRAELAAKFEALEQEYGEAIPFPDYWGGYLVTPFQIEFWQGRPNRLHDRLRYRLVENNWILERLQP